MAMPRELLGSINCFNPNCGIVVPVKRSAGGAVAASCAYCDLQAYGKDGTQAKADILKMMRPFKASEEPPEPKKPEPSPPPAPIAQPTPPAPAKKRPLTIFG